MAPAPVASMEELSQFAEMLARLGEKHRTLVEKVASLLRSVLHARGVTVVIEGTVATAGDPVTTPILTAPLTAEDGVLGQITLSERDDGAYTTADSRKLEHYAKIVTQILRAASTQWQWRQLAATDDCSGLPNRRYLRERLDEVLVLAARERFPVTLLLFDIDDFKSFNDTYGHNAGDEILRLTGELFRQHCREQDIVARYGGDEFIVVFWESQGPRTPGSRHPDCAVAVLERVREALRSQRFPALGPSGTGCLSIGGGLATYPWDAATSVLLSTPTPRHASRGKQKASPIQDRARQLHSHGAMQENRLRPNITGQSTTAPNPVYSTSIPCPYFTIASRRV